VGRPSRKPVVDYDELYSYFTEERCYVRGERSQEHSYRSYGGWKTAVNTGCGISLDRPPLEWDGYWCTPVNSIRFASTGGDGTHFSLVYSDEDREITGLSNTSK
jgi:hypothetical protein